MNLRRLLPGLAGLALCSPGHADHSWGGYHWARTSDSFDLTLVNSTTSDWDGYVAVAVSYWSTSSKLNFVEDPSGSTADNVRRRCNAPTGQVRICNLAYGQTGWLGIAGISIDSNNHIVRGYTKLNDTYFASDFYNNPQWKQTVTCQELGHDIGLDHQDDDFNNAPRFTCMDYQDPPYPYPNQHDYDELALIYGHLDSYDSYVTSSSSGGDSGGSGCNAPANRGCNKSGTPNNASAEWGRSLGRRGQQETFMRVDPDGSRHITFVTWAMGH